MEKQHCYMETLVEELIAKLRISKRGIEFSPHKFMLLLSVINLFKENDKRENKFTFLELEPIFLDCFNFFYPEVPDYRKMLEYPFYHLQSDGFWHLQIKEGKEYLYQTYRNLRFTKKRLLETVSHAYLSKELYELMQDGQCRQALEEKIKNCLLSVSPTSERLLSLKDDMNGLHVAEASSLYEHEQLAIDIIKRSIFNHNLGKLLNNVWLLDSNSNNYYEYDIILVGSSSIFVVELKHWSGHIRIAPHNWIINGTHYRSDPHKNNSLKCKILKNIYQHYFRTYPELWVESVVVLTNPDAMIEGAATPQMAIDSNLRNPTFGSIADFIAYLKKREALKARLLDDQQIGAIVDYFYSLNNPRPTIKFNVPGYETVEYISQTPERVELVARPIDGRAKGLHRFRVFRLSYNALPEEKNRFIKVAYNTLNAVSQIGDHPNILKVWVMQNENGDIIEGSQWSETGTLRDFIRTEKRAFPVETALRITQGIALALCKAHQLDVIHRAVKPENILMVNDIPKLMNFDLSYQVEDNRLTVINDVTKLKDDGYIAPEVLSGEDIDEGTDFFSLGVIAYELLTGAKPFTSTKAFVARGGLLDQQATQKLVKAGVPTKTVNALQAMIVADRALRLKDGKSVLAAFTLEDIKDSDLSANNQILQSGSRYDVYEILEFIGKGTEAQIYKARTLLGGNVTLKLFNKEIPSERIFKEAQISSAIDSAYTIHCDNKIGYWANDRFFIVFDYIDGVSMREQIDRNQRPDPDTFRTIALCLMEAVEAFHEHKDTDGSLKPLLHSDIKPDNVIITKDNKPVLIDCGIAGEPRIDVFQGTSGYVPPDSIRGTDMQFSQDGDLFALGVTLWEWLFGVKPYKTPTIGESPELPDGLADNLPENIRSWLKKAVATEASQRFASIQEMKEAFLRRAELIGNLTVPQEDEADTAYGVQELAFQEVDEPLAVIRPEKVLEEPQPVISNPFVLYLNSLSSDSAGNENATAEAQITNPFFQKIFVTNPVTDFILKKLVDEQRNVILTGNAGDGKTTIAADIYARISKEYREMHPIEEIGRLIIVKDMSELTKDDRRLLFAKAIEGDGNNYLIVSNTGKLLEVYKKLDEDENELLAALAADAPTSVLNERFLVLNLGRLDSIDISCSVFRRMLEQTNWIECRKCNYNDDCPIYGNVKLLQTHLDLVCERVKLLYRRLYEYGVRLTMRQMTGHLAYAITAGLECTKIRGMSQTALKHGFLGSLFFNRFFGDNGHDVIPETLQLLAIQQIRKVEFGVILDPYFEKKMWVEGKTLLPIAEEAKPLLQSLEASISQNSPAARRQVRRLLYFFGLLDDQAGKRYISTYLRSPTLLKYLDLTLKPGPIPALEANNIRRRILQVLQEFFIGLRLPEGEWKEKDLYITLSRRKAGSGTQIVIADFRNEDFELKTKPRYQVIEGSPKLLWLCYKKGNAEMHLDLPFFDYMEGRYEGKVAEELSVYYADRLERFKATLIDAYSCQDQDYGYYLKFLRIGPNHNFKLVKLRVTDKSLEALL